MTHFEKLQLRAHAITVGEYARLVTRDALLASLEGTDIEETEVWAEAVQTFEYLINEDYDYAMTVLAHADRLGAS